SSSSRYADRSSAMRAWTSPALNGNLSTVVPPRSCSRTIPARQKFRCALQQPIAQVQAASIQPRLHGAQVRPGRLGDLVVAESLQVGEDHHSSLLDRQVEQAGLDLSDQLAAERRAFGESA